jgi:guanosine-3',5'-bis(diphosphate) 3'-pyrophosphohydrolase
MNSRTSRRISSEKLSDDKSLDWIERKQLQIEHAPTISAPAKMIKVADKICNIRDIINDPPDWPRERKLTYIGWAEKVVEGCRGANPAWRLFSMRR